jgi:hypothetical protein
MPVTGRARPREKVEPRTEVLGVGVGAGGVGEVTGATTGSRPKAVVAVDVLFARFESASLPFTLAVLFNVAGTKPPCDGHGRRDRRP